MKTLFYFLLFVFIAAFCVGGAVLAYLAGCPAICALFCIFLVCGLLPLASIIE